VDEGDRGGRVIDATPRQLRVLTFWLAHTDEKGYPPTLREACQFFGFRSTNAAADHVRALIRKGLLRSSGGWMASRGVIVTELGRSLVGAPPRRRQATGTVVQEQKCSACGASHFVEGQTRCAECARRAA
jgi:SOS-response transcriptional repressor LexA